MKKAILVLMAIMLAASVAAQAEVEAGTIPGSLFYGLDRAGEGLRTAFTFSSQKKAELYMRYAEERLAELDEVIEKNRTKQIEKLVRDRERALNKSEERINKEEGKGKDVTALREKIEEMHQKHINVLQGLLDKVPEQAREHIQNAIQKSSRSKAPESVSKETPVQKQEGKQEAGGAKEKPAQGLPNEVKGNSDEGKAGQATTGAGNPSIKSSTEPAATGKLQMQITDNKPETLNITGLEVTISEIMVHCAEYGGSSQQVCVDETYTEEVCTEETVDVIVEICTNETVIEEICNNSVCENVTVEKEVCTNETQQEIELVCENVTNTNTNCSTQVEQGENWFTVVEGPLTFDLIQIKDVKEFLGEKELTAGKYTQIRLSVDDATLYISGEEKPLKIPSEKIKLVNAFEIGEGETKVLTLDFDAEKSVHQADSQYIMQPTIKVIEE